MTARRSAVRTHSETVSAGRRLTQIDKYTWAVVAPTSPGHFKILSLHETQGAALRTLSSRI